MTEGKFDSICKSFVLFFFLRFDMAICECKCETPINETKYSSSQVVIIVNKLTYTEIVAICVQLGLAEMLQQKFSFKSSNTKLRNYKLLITQFLISTT